MIPSITPGDALLTAGRGAMLVARPVSAVAHVYVGPVTPSGRHVPRAGRTVCNTRTGRLSLVTFPASGSGPRRLCHRCARALAPAAAAAPVPVTRQDWLARYRDWTATDIAAAASAASTVAEVERCEYLALLVVGYPACKTDPVPTPGTDEMGPPLDVLIARARTRVGAAHDQERAETFDRLLNTAIELRKYERELARTDRNERIRRLGFLNATG